MKRKTVNNISLSKQNTNLQPVLKKTYYIFLSSPSDMDKERQVVRDFIQNYNKTTANNNGLNFEVLDFESYVSRGAGDPQTQITTQTLERYSQSLILFIGIMGQRFGTPTSMAASGTEDEYNWAVKNYQKKRFPEIKWFFKEINAFVAPPELTKIEEALSQWKKVNDFREAVKSQTPKIFYNTFKNINDFEKVFSHDLQLWLNDPDRPWSKKGKVGQCQEYFEAPLEYYKKLRDEFCSLDISGIDNDRAFNMPLKRIYLRLKVVHETSEFSNTDVDIHKALREHRFLVIVGDPGSGKSTFLKYICLTLAQAKIDGKYEDSKINLGIDCPLPIPIIISCLDLIYYHNSNKKEIDLRSFYEYLAVNLSYYNFPIEKEKIHSVLNYNCILLFDGLDEVPTDEARSQVSKLIGDIKKSHPMNRIIATSRTRAYKGDVILKDGFARCDIQPLKDEDKKLFLQNWFSVLFNVDEHELLTVGTKANNAYRNLLYAMENDRIQTLAINPLLLTVIAIVHWNRRRLPEQRCELYDECVDVLLGQRKDAEHTQKIKKPVMIDNANEAKTLEDRAWIRKRFSEIAFHIFKTNSEEIDNDTIVKLLTSRFIDRDNIIAEKARIRAIYFLEQQEIRSGLLVRRTNSFRFIHMSFQEYLAAWNLANQEFEEIKKDISENLMRQNWFEVFLLLGGEYAKRSDELLDRYINYLLSIEVKGSLKATIIATLCNGILRDTEGIASIRPETKNKFEVFLETSSLNAFKETESGDKSQLELVEALLKLKKAAVPCLKKAKNSAFPSVRRAAFAGIKKHLSDDELFKTNYCLGEEDITCLEDYVKEMINRDSQRTVRCLKPDLSSNRSLRSALIKMFASFSKLLSEDEIFDVYPAIILHDRDIDLFIAFVDRYQRSSRLTLELINFSQKAYNNEIRCRAITKLATMLGDEQLRGILTERINHDKDSSVRIKAIEQLKKCPRNKKTQNEIICIAKKDKDSQVCEAAIEYLSASENNLSLFIEIINQNRESSISVAALKAIFKSTVSKKRKWEIFCDILKNIKDEQVWSMAITMLVSLKKVDSQKTKMIVLSFLNDPGKLKRLKALELISDVVEPKKRVFEIFSNMALKDSSEALRIRALEMLVEYFGYNNNKQFIVKIAKNDTSDNVRMAAYTMLIENSRGKLLNEIVEDGLEDKSEELRSEIIDMLIDILDRFILKENVELFKLLCVQQKTDSSQEIRIKIKDFIDTMSLLPFYEPADVDISDSFRCTTQFSDKFLDQEDI